jgi:multidrug efflux pump subunit AcrA (membrane-fusion protein)
VAKRVDVTLGQRFDDRIEVVSDEIKEGDQIVVTGQARLVDGVKLEIVNK